jgi:hypothetical protein
MIRKTLLMLAITLSFSLGMMAPATGTTTPVTATQSVPAIPILLNHGNDFPVSPSDTFEERDTSKGMFDHDWRVGNYSMNACDVAIYNHWDATRKYDVLLKERNPNDTTVWSSKGHVALPGQVISVTVAPGAAIAFSKEPYLRVNVYYQSGQNWHADGFVSLDLFNHIAGEFELAYAYNSQDWPGC